MNAARLLLSTLLAALASPLAVFSTEAPVTLLEPELLVDSVPDDYVEYPTVALDDNGNDVFVWKGGSQVDWEAQARLMTAAGQFMGPQWTLSDPRVGVSVYSPKIAHRGSTRFVALWASHLPESSPPYFGPRGQLLDSSAPAPVPDFQVAGSTPQAGPVDVCALPTGEFLAAWRSDVLHGYDYVPAPWIRRFDASGAPASGDVLVDDPAVQELEAEVGIWLACDAQGRAAVIWLADNREDFGTRLKGRILGPDLVPLSPIFAVTDEVYDSHWWPDVVMGLDGVTTVLFMGHTEAGFDVLGQRIALDGSRLGAPFVVNDYAPGGQMLWAAAADSAGRYAVVWEQGVDPAGRLSEIYARLYSPSGEPIGASFHVNPDPADDPWTDSQAAVDLSDQGRLAFAWNSWLGDDQRYAIRAARYQVGCVSDAATLCLGGGRFRVRARYRASEPLAGAAQAVPLAGDTGGFWFFGPDNLELLVKVLDGCGTNDHFWVYAAGLTDVEVELEVLDVWTGKTWTTTHPQGSPFPLVRDVDAFATCDAPSFGARAAPPPPPALAPPCPTDDRHLCLAGGRFLVGADFLAYDGSAGAARAVPLTDESGSFWFFWPDNLELIVKVLDACVPFGRYWVYAAGLTDVAVTLDVQDLETGAIRRYSNPLGYPFTPIHDVGAFAGCP